MVHCKFTINVLIICHETNLNCYQVACNSFNRKNPAIIPILLTWGINVVIYRINKRLFHRFFHLGSLYL